MIKFMLIAGAGSFIGGMLRFAVGVFFQKLLPAAFPWATLTVNIIGCFFIGVFLSKWQSNDVARVFLASGICGGFTTFSALSFESLQMISKGVYWQLIIYIAASLILGIASTYIGWSGKWF